MPNIEIHGLWGKEAVQMVDNIRKVMEGSPEKDDYVTTILGGTVRDRLGVLQPFLRLVTSEKDSVEDILERLKPLGMDVEVLLLYIFVPKSKKV